MVLHKIFECYNPIYEPTSFCIENHLIIGFSGRLCCLISLESCSATIVSGCCECPVLKGIMKSQYMCCCSTSRSLKIQTFINVLIYSETILFRCFRHKLPNTSGSCMTCSQYIKTTFCNSKILKIIGYAYFRKIRLYVGKIPLRSFVV